MPGEEYENAERLEREAIANGENFNPNLTDEAAAGFENLGDDVPFAGDTDVAMTAAEIAVEGPAVAAADVAVSEGLKLVGDIMQDGEESQTPSKMAASISKKHDSDNAVAAKFNEQWDEGKVPDLDKVQEAVERDYIDGAIEQSATNPDAAADIANTERNVNERPDAESEPVADQPHDIAEAAAIQSVAASALAEDLADDIKNGNEDAKMRIEEVKERANEAIASADKISIATLENSDDNLETRMATDVAEQAADKALEAIDTVENAENEFNAMTEEEKAETQAAAEAAEANGTTIEEEKAKAEEEKKENNEDDSNWSPDLSRGIFG
jgi:hypothetical protein